jgi:hypothetical protein
MYDRISLPQEEITVDGEQVIYQVEIDGQNAIICDTLTSQVSRITFIRYVQSRFYFRYRMNST